MDEHRIDPGDEAGGTDRANQRRKPYTKPDLMSYDVATFTHGVQANINPDGGNYFS
jgi:hypothetical protein